MPFTPAHTAILFPARWIKPSLISWTALIIGSMVPDTEYFLWMNSASYISHTLAGTIVFNLPMVFLIGFAWHSFIAKGLLPKIPFIKAKYAISPRFDFPIWLKKNMLVFTISAFIGIISHLIWDSFCHSKGFMVNKIPLLLEHTTIAGHQIRWCYIMWYASTLSGMLFIAIIGIDFKSLFELKQWKKLKANFPFYCKILLLAVVISAIRIAFGLNHNIPRHLIIIAISSILYSIMLLTFFERKQTVPFKV